MPAVAVLAAAVSCAFVLPDAGYSEYVDWATLARLAAMLAVVAALREEGVFQAAARFLVARCRSSRALVAVLVGVTAVASMFVTNDMALLALLPLAAAVFLEAGRADLIARTFVLQGIAANLCGMLLPFGNPQNIFLSARYAVGFGDFVAVMSAPFLVSCALIAIALAVLTRREGGSGRPGRGGDPVDAGVLPDAEKGGASDGADGPAAATLDRRRAGVLAALLGVCVVAVLGYVPAWAALVVVLAGLVVLDRGPRCLGRIDWGLLVTFAAFFVFSGNLSRIGAVADAFGVWLAGGAFVPAALLSQVISNVPAAVVLARFTGDWRGLLAGVNAGGAGTPVGSLATLIVIAQFQGLVRRLPQTRRAELAPDRFMGMLVGINMAFLVALLLVGVLLGW